MSHIQKNINTQATINVDGDDDNDNNDDNNDEDDDNADCRIENDRRNRDR